MSKGKYLGELLTREELLNESNSLVISPCGSGKTYFIFNQLITRKDRVLYLCDNTNLKKAILNDNSNAVDRHRPIAMKITARNVEVMTYKKLGTQLRHANFSEILKDYTYVVADEIHNLLDYENFNGDGDLGRAISLLFNKQDIPIILLTATPYYLEKVQNSFNNFLKEIKVFDFMENEEINRYINIREAYISHISQIQYEFRCYKQFFKLRDGKALVYCPNIQQMKMIEQMAINENLNPISIWSEHNTDYRLTDEQVAVRDKIITEGVLDDKYDVLIINRALETGVNITDKRFRLFISCTTNKTQTIQARSRLRMDVDLVLLKSKYTIIPSNFVLELEDKWLDRPLLREDIEEILAELDLKDGEGRPMGVVKLCQILEKNNYEVKSTTRRFDGRRLRCRIITKKKKTD